MNELSLFKNFRRQIIEQVGLKALTNLQLDDYGKRLLGKQYIGTFAQDKVPLSKSGYCIINTDTSKGKGIHWVGLRITPKNIYVYDSFGRPTSRLLKILSNKAKRLNLKIIDSEYDAEQFGSKSETCGQMCLAWLLVAKRLGIKNALKI